MFRTGLLLALTSALAATGGTASAADVCTELKSRLAALEIADRDQWEAEATVADPYAIERQRTVVLRALAANRCRSAEAQRNKRPNRLFAGLFGNKRPFRGGFRDGWPFRDGSFGSSLPSGTYRTLCVRTCDGYYFPISFSASGDDLQRDQTACRALCSGQDVALYIQPNPGSDGGPMVSLAGEPYTDLPTAYRYRAEYDRSCACGPVDESAAAAFRAYASPPPDQVPTHDGAAASGEVLPMPLARSRGDDPDTVDNRIGRFAVRAAVRAPAEAAVYREGPNGKVVRLVGPAEFLAGE